MAEAGIDAILVPAIDKGIADLYTMNLKQLMKCCMGVLVPDGQMIPFCAYNCVGYREQAPASLSPIAITRP